MVGNLPLNLKQTYQSNSICPSSLFLSKTCPKQNIFQIVIITLLCMSKKYLTSSSWWVCTFFPHKFVAIIGQFVLFVCFLLGMWTFSRIWSWVSSPWCNSASCFCCKSSFYFSCSESKMEIRPTYSLGPTSLLGFLKLYLFKVSLQSLSLFLFASKTFSNLDIKEDF